MKRHPNSDARGSAIQVRFGGKFTRGTLVILGIFTLSYLLLQLPKVGPFVAQNLLLWPKQALGVQPYQLLTAPLIATDLFGLIFLGLLLWSVGSAIELRIGLRRFLWWGSLCSLAMAVAAAAVGRILPGPGEVVPLGGSALFPLVLIAFAQLYGDAQVTMWGIGQPMSSRKVSYFFVGLGLVADLFSRSWPHLAGQLAAVLCALLLTQGGAGVVASLQKLWRRRRRSAAGIQVMDGGRPGPQGSTPRREPPRWVN